MSYMINGKQGVSLAKETVQSRELSWSEPPPLVKINWLIYLQHVRGEINNCNNLIQDEIKRTHARNDYVYFQQGTILKENGKLQEALDSFQICYKLNPKNIDNIKIIGVCLYQLRRYKMAMEAFLEAEKCTEKPDWEIAHRLSECLLNLDDLNGAKDYARKAVQLGKQEMSYALLMKILILSDDVRSAIAVSNAALECYPESPNMLTESAILYMRVGQTSLAFDRLNTVLGIQPNTPKALLAAGSIIQNSGEPDNALIKYKMAVTSTPSSVSLWNNIGLCFYSKRKYVAAMSCLKRALWYSPLNWRILYNLGLVHMSIGQSASAFNSLCAAVNLRPDNGQAFMMLACALLDLKDTENALRALEQACALSPEDPVVAANTALCAHLNGKSLLAAQILRKLTELIDQNSNVHNDIIELASKLKEVIQTPTEQDEKGDGAAPETEEGEEQKENDYKGRELGPDEV